MSVSVRFDEGGAVDIEGLGGASYSHLNVTDAETTYTIGQAKLVAAREYVRLYREGVLVHEWTYERKRA